MTRPSSIVFAGVALLLALVPATVAGSEFIRFSPKAPPAENPLGDVRLQYGGRTITLKSAYVRRFMGRTARETSVGMSEWWLDAVLTADVELDPMKYPRVFISLVGGNGNPLPVYYEDAGRVVKALGANPQSRRLLCKPFTGEAAVATYAFGGYPITVTEEPGIGRDLLDRDRLSSKVLLCFLGCTPPEPPVAGIRIEPGDPWTDEQLEKIKRGELP